MNVSDGELRDMVRESIARLAGARPQSVQSSEHPSFVRLPVLGSGDADGNCLIEPSVRCNHCGYCLSYGH